MGGVGSAYQEQSGCSVFTLGMNVDYLKELFSGDEVEIRTQLLDWDYNKVHYFLSMWHASIGKMAASNECLAMNTTLKDKKGAPFPIKVQQRYILSIQNLKGKKVRSAPWHKRSDRLGCSMTKY